jgi:hypothetical protein
MHFCTYFDRGYLHRGLALYRSLARHGGAFTLWILCFDDPTFVVLSALRLPNVRLIRREDFEADDAALVEAKRHRSRLEYYWTCTPSLPLYIFAHDPTVRALTYLDADMFFFGDPQSVVDELGTGSILIVPHDYSAEYAGEQHSGKYNVGIVLFRADETGLACLRRWREQCIAWCFARHEQGKFGDQAYLDAWPSLYPGVVISASIGLRLAPWNVGKYGVSVGADGQLRAGGERLICYHFHALYFCRSRLVFLAGWPIALDANACTHVYAPYLRELLLAERDTAVPILRKGIPWRYIGGRILKRQPVRNFMWIDAPKSPVS